MKKFEMELLNPEEMNLVIGGKDKELACMKLVGKIVLCATYEANCPATFTYCSGKDTMKCSSDFTIGPKPSQTLPLDLIPRKVGEVSDGIGEVAFLNV